HDLAAEAPTAADDAGRRRVPRRIVAGRMAVPRVGLRCRLRPTRGGPSLYTPGAGSRRAARCRHAACRLFAAPRRRTPGPARGTAQTRAGRFGRVMRRALLQNYRCIGEAGRMMSGIALGASRFRKTALKSPAPE